MANIAAMKLPDNSVYNLKDSRVAVPVPANAVFTDHIYESKSAVSGGTEQSLVTTGEKSIWNEKAEVVELTQAEYDALPSSQKNADIVYLITDSSDNYLDVDEIFGGFASVEHTSTASKAYVVGEYLVYNRKFYKVTTAIASGGTITVGTNVVKTTVAEEMANKVLYLKNIPVSATTGNIVNYSDARITPQHVLVESTWANPTYITTSSTWSTETAGKLTINGTCTTATTINVTLAR